MAVNITSLIKLGRLRGVFDFHVSGVPVWKLIRAFRDVPELWVDISCVLIA